MSTSRTRPATRRLLTVAAAIGPVFPPGLAARVDGLAGAAEAAVDEALARRVVERRGDRLAFVHDGIRNALLAGLDEAERRALHQSIAGALEQLPSDDPEHVHALARHYLLGDVERAGERVAVACLAAGRLALASRASEEAVECFEAVDRLADRVSWIITHEVDELLGAAYYQAGRLGDAQRLLTRALEGVPTRLDRARVLYLPDELAAGETLPAVVVVGRASSTKGQIPAVYAQRLSELGYAAIAFDHTSYGQSEGTPRTDEDPFAKIEDIKGATTFLARRPDAFFKHHLA